MSSVRCRIIFLAVSSLLLLLCLYQPPDPTEEATERQQRKTELVREELPEILLIAHRGDSAHCPENTMAAFQAAVKAGADGIELDIQETRDHAFVVCHDQNLFRTAGIDCSVSDLRCEELCQLDVGSWFSDQFCGQCIPTLEEALRFGRENQLLLNIEIKGSLSSGAEATLSALLRHFQMEDQCILACQDYSMLTRLKARTPELRTLYVTISPPVDLLSLVDADEISVLHSAVDAALIERAHDCGKRIHVWTVDTPELLRSMAALHPDAIITDDPALAKDILEEAS